MFPLSKVCLLLLLKLMSVICYDVFFPPYPGNRHGNTNVLYPQSFGGADKLGYNDKDYIPSSMVSDDESRSSIRGLNKYDRLGGKREDENPHPWNPPMDDKSYKTLKELSRVMPSSKADSKHDPQLNDDDDTDYLDNVILQDDAKLLLSLLLIDQLKNSPKINTVKNSNPTVEKDVARLYYNTKSMPPYDYRDLYSPPLIERSEGSMEISRSNNNEGLTLPKKSKGYSYAYGRLSVPTAKRKHGHTYYYGVEIPRYNPYD